MKSSTRALVALAVIALTAVAIPRAGVVAPEPKAVAQSGAPVSAADYAYKWNPSTWGLSTSYVEWWYVKVSEVPGRENDPTPGVQENYFFQIEVVNPWDTREPPKESTTGAYVYFGSMIGEERQMLVAKLPVSAFSSQSADRAAIRVCADDPCGTFASLASDPTDGDVLSLHLRFDLSDARLSFIQRKGTVDPEERSVASGETAPAPLAGYTALSADLAIRRTVGFVPGDGITLPGDATNPLINWLVFAVDGDVLQGSGAPSSIEWARDDGSQRTIDLTSGDFRAYADTNWGTAFPEAWIWGQAVWPGTDTKLVIGGGCPRGVEQCRDGALSPDTWSGDVFIQFLNQRADPPRVDTYAHAAAENPLKWRVTAQVDGNRDDYVDQEGWWQVPHAWRVTLEDPRGCSADPAAADRRRATIEVSTDAAHVFDLNISSPWMRPVGALGQGLNAGGDPFHDFEALEATSKLWLWYCDAQTGNWAPEVAPDGSHNWPIVADIGTFEFGIFRGRIESPEVFASPARARLDNGRATVDYYAKNIGGEAADGVTLTLGVRSFDPSTGSSATKLLCTSASPLRPRGEWLAPGERQDGSDTLGQSCTYTPGSGHSVILDPPAAAEGNRVDERGEQALTWVSTLRVQSCEVFQVVAVVADRQRDLTNDARSTTWCPFTDPVNVRVSIADGASGATFQGGARNIDLVVIPGAPVLLPVVALGSGAADVPITVTRLDTGASDVAVLHATAPPVDALGSLPTPAGGWREGVDARRAP
jgi:hypothetical protein